jgi:isopenicillin-N N-acyltransferase-like protein
MARSLPLVRLRGAPGEVGEAHGRAVAGPIAHNLEVYARRFTDEARLTRAEVRRRTSLYWETLLGQSPDFATMIEGISAGCGQPLLDVAAMNFRYEFLYGEFSRIGQQELGTLPSPAGECTAFAVLPEASADGHLRIGQNWDWIPDVEGVLTHVTRPDGLRVLCFTEAGVAGGKIGMNSAGLGLAINGLLSNEDDWSRRGRPFHVRTWEVLCSDTLNEALNVVTRGPRSCSANFLIAQAGPRREGTAVDVETAPHVACLIEPTGGVLAHANHFADPDRLGVWQPLVEEKRSTYHRCGRMERLLAEAAAGGGASRSQLQAMLRDHQESPESVCRHPNPELPQDERYATVVSIIMDLHAGRFLAAPGPPCTQAYQEYVV